MRSRHWGRAGAALVAVAATVSGFGVVRAGSGTPAVQVATGPSGSVLWVAVPPAWGTGSPGFQALLVDPGSGVVASGSDGQMDMARPWAALRTYDTDTSGLKALPACSALSNPASWHIGADSTGAMSASFEITCGGTAFRVNLVQWGAAWPSSVGRPAVLTTEWGTPTASTIHLSYIPGTWDYEMTAQICRQAGTGWDCMAPMNGGGQLDTNVSALSVQELTTN